MAAGRPALNESMMTAPTTLSDEELLRLILAGDESAFATLYGRRQGGVYRFALRMSGSEALAEDVTQEVFLALMRDPGLYDPARGSLSAYLYGIARNQVLSRLGRDQSYVPMAEEAMSGEAAVSEQLMTRGDPLSDLTRQETIESVRQAVLALPAHYREVVVLCDLQELSYAEAAGVLGCAVGTVRSRLSRARALLVRKLRATTAADSAPGRINTARCFA
jgi:RNA polymerase sigma-70 factor (ECF subfamily)